MSRSPDAGSAGAARALVLFAHGARDAAWTGPLARLQAEIERRAPGLRVELAFLELQSPDLPHVLEALVAGGFTQLVVAPVFWASGGHVARDLPRLVEAFRARHPAAGLRVLPALSDLPGMNDFLAGALLATVQE
jgi:sirohydrochlorin cobaltochelatase